ncbi:MAG: NADPH-dependent F420 reductase [Candidatus Binatia bacterium]
MRIAILGGTGPEGLGIAARLAAAGMPVVIGSRSAERANSAADNLRQRLPDADLSAATNCDAAGGAEVVFLAVPWVGMDHIIETCGEKLEGKIVVDTIVPLRADKGFFDVEVIPEGSAGERLQAKLSRARVVSALKNQSAAHLGNLGHPMEGDVVICGNDDEAKKVVGGLLRRIPDQRPVDAGDLRNCRALERMTALLMNLNRRHRARTSFRITGI